MSSIQALLILGCALAALVVSSPAAEKFASRMRQ